MKNIILIICLLFGSCINIFGADGIKIFQIYGGGGNTNAPYNKDFIVLYNNSTSDITMTNWSIQYSSSSGSSWSSLLLNATIPSNKFYVIEINTGNSIGNNLPYRDVTWNFGAGGLSYTAGKIALMDNSTTLTSAVVVGAQDLFGYGSGANAPTAFEGLAEPSPSVSAANPVNTLSYVRSNSGLDTDNNATDFTTVNVQSVTTLSVNLLSFTAKNEGDGIQLSWQTASEENSDYFELQKTKDLKEYTTVSIIKSVGNATDINNYGFFDANPEIGTNYYRLKQVDINGDSKLYNAISVNFNIEEKILSVFPNPILNGQKLKIKTHNIDFNSLVVFNSRGQKIDFESIDTNNNISTVKIKNSNPGVFFIKSTTNPNLVKKFVINN